MMPMKTRYRLFERNTGIFFNQDNISGKQESLRTRAKQAALRLLHARNEAHKQPAINREIAKAYVSQAPIPPIDECIDLVRRHL